MFVYSSETTSSFVSPSRRIGAFHGGGAVRAGEDEGAERTRGGKTLAEAGGLFVGGTAACETAEEEEGDGCGGMQLVHLLGV